VLIVGMLRNLTSEKGEKCRSQKKKPAAFSKLPAGFWNLPGNLYELLFNYTSKMCTFDVAIKEE
jgi:hypothetical protein